MRLTTRSACHRVLADEMTRSDGFDSLATMAGDARMHLGCHGCDDHPTWTTALVASSLTGAPVAPGQDPKGL